MPSISAVTTQRSINYTLVPAERWEVIAEEIFQIEDINFLWIVDYQPVSYKEACGQAVSTYISLCWKSIFEEYGLLRKKVCYGANFFSGKFKTISSKMNIQQVVPSSFHCQSNGQVVYNKEFYRSK